MARPNDVLISTLLDVMAEGVAVIDKRKLLWMMGKGQDRPAVWAELVEHWEELGGKADDLIGGEISGKMVFGLASLQMEKVSDWAN